MLRKCGRHCSTLLRRKKSEIMSEEEEKAQQTTGPSLCSKVNGHLYSPLVIDFQLPTDVLPAETYKAPTFDTQFVLIRRTRCSVRWYPSQTKWQSNRGPLCTKHSPANVRVRTCRPLCLHVVMCVCVGVCGCARACVCVCVCVRARTRARARACVCTYNLPGHMASMFRNKLNTETNPHNGSSLGHLKHYCQWKGTCFSTSSF